MGYKFVSVWLNVSTHFLCWSRWWLSSVVCWRVCVFRFLCSSALEVMFQNEKFKNEMSSSVHHKTTCLPLKHEIHTEIKLFFPLKKVSVCFKRCLMQGETFCRWCIQKGFLPNGGGDKWYRRHLSDIDEKGRKSDYRFKRRKHIRGDILGLQQVKWVWVENTAS